MRKVIHFLITATALALAVYFIKDYIFSPSLATNNIALLMSLTILIHFLKFLRLYTLFLEEHLKITSVLKIYLKTTFISISFPFKTGEIYKAYTYGYALENYPKGLVALLIERFFDVLVLCLVLVPACFFFGDENLSIMVYLMGIFVISIIIVCLFFEKTYTYLNRRLIVRGSNAAKNIRALKATEKIHDIYKSAKNMIEGRQLVVGLLSIGAWAAEIFLLIVVGGTLKRTVNVVEVGKYVSDGFFGTENDLYIQYMSASMIVLAIGTLVSLSLSFHKLVQERRKK